MSAMELKIPPLALTLAFGGLMWLSASVCPQCALTIPWRTALALSLALCGAAFATAGAHAFLKARTTANPTRPGDAATIVSSGIYRYSRNPMYVGLLLTLAGWGIALSNLLALSLLPLFVAYLNRFQIQPEERALRAKFGAEFEAYARAVRRWF